MNVRSLAASIVAAHNSKSSAQAIDTSNIHRLELLRLGYVRVASPLRVRLRFEAGIVDEAAFAQAQCAHAIAVARWEADRICATRASVADSPAPLKPRAPRRFDFACFVKLDHEAVTAPIERSARLFDPALVFPGWSQSKLRAREDEFLMPSSEPFTGLAVVDPVAPARPLDTVAAELAKQAGTELVDALAAGTGHEFCRQVRLVEAQWVRPPQPTSFYLLRARISRGRDTITTELGLNAASNTREVQVRLDEHLPRRFKRWALAGAGLAATAMLVGASIVFLGPEVAGTLRHWLAA